MDGVGQSVSFASHAAFFDWMQVIALFLSVLVAAGAAWYAIREGRRNQTRSEFTVSPAIMFIRDRSTEGSVGATIRSVGNGPAIIDDVYVLYRGVPQHATLSDLKSSGDWWTTLVRLIGEKYSNWFPEISALRVRIGGLLQGEILGAGQSFPILVMDGAIPAEQIANFKSAMQHVEVIVFYHSVHGRSFVSLAQYDARGNMGACKSPKDWMEKNCPMPPEHVKPVIKP